MPLTPQKQTVSVQAVSNYTLCVKNEECVRQIMIPFPRLVSLCHSQLSDCCESQLRWQLERIHTRQMNNRERKVWVCAFGVCFCVCLTRLCVRGWGYVRSIFRQDQKVLWYMKIPNNSSSLQHPKGKSKGINPTQRKYSCSDDKSPV